MHTIWYQMLKIASVGELTTLPHRPTPIVVRSFLPFAISPLCTINACIVQGSGLGPTDFVIAISSLKPKYSENRLNKYADNSYLLVPASCIDSTLSELDHFSKWASIRPSNLKLSHAKTREMVVRRPKSKPIALIPGIERVQEMVILGDRFGFGANIDKICCKIRQSMFALRLLIAHGYHGQRLFDVVEVTTRARLLYASSVWWGFATVRERKRLNGI